MLIPLVGVELMPATDESEVRVYAEMAVGNRLDLVNRSFQKIEAIVKQESPEIPHGFVGFPRFLRLIIGFYAKRNFGHELSINLVIYIRFDFIFFGKGT